MKLNRYLQAQQSLMFKQLLTDENVQIVEFCSVFYCHDSNPVLKVAHENV